MKITDKLAFEDAQIMARLAVHGDGLVSPESFWWAAMQALKAAYKVQPVVVTIAAMAANITNAQAAQAMSTRSGGEIIEAPKRGVNHV
ncbi:hypothetical protein LU447_004307 [Salmonella enterica]|nr:hypothetical protein [Salmonella enterica]